MPTDPSTDAATAKDVPVVQSARHRHVFILRCPEADEVILCCDCLGWFPMRRGDSGRWRLELHLPPGQHHIRYYVRIGRTTVYRDEESRQVVRPEHAGRVRGDDDAAVGP